MVAGVYIDVVRINEVSGDIDDAKSFANVSATPASFKLQGGKYGVTVIGTFTNYQVQKLGGDGSTYVGVQTAVTSAGMSVLDLPVGDYKVVLT